MSPALGTAQPIHGGIRISCNGGAAIIEATNGERHFTASVALADYASRLAILVPGRTLGRFLDAVEPDVDAVVEITADADTTFQVGESQLTLRQFDPDTWPEFSEASEAVGSLSPEDAGRIRSVLFAASSDPDRGALVGIHLANGYATATDNHRLARVKVTTELPPVLVPASFLQYPLRANVDELQVQMSANQVRFFDTGGSWATQLLLQPFPNVDPVLNRAVSAELAFDTTTLRRALDHLAVLDRVHVVQLLRTPEGVATLSASDEALGRIEEHLAVEGTWFGTTCFRSVDLRDAVRAHDLTTTCLQFTGETKHVLLVGDAIQQAIGSQRCG